MPATPSPLSSRRRVRVAALLLATSAALAGCSSEDPQPSGALPSTTVPDLPSVADGVSQDGVPLLVNIGVAGGQVTGAGTTVSLRQGTPVRVTVTSDVADILLIEGYQVRAQLTINDPVQVSFIATRTGTFEVVLEQTGTVLTRLEVS